MEGYPDANFEKDGPKILAHPCDILIPAAMEGVITDENASLLQCKVNAEAANRPDTYEADKNKNKRNIFIIPNEYFKAGGVTVLTLSGLTIFLM